MTRSHSLLIRRTTLTSFLTAARSLTPESHRPLAIRWCSMVAFIINSAAMVQPSACLLRLLSLRLSNPKWRSRAVRSSSAFRWWAASLTLSSRMFRSRRTRSSVRPDFSSKFIRMASPNSCISFSRRSWRSMAFWSSFARFLFFSSRDGRGLPLPLLIMSLALAFVFLMLMTPGFPSASGFSLATASVRRSKLPSSFSLPVRTVVGAPA